MGRVRWWKPKVLNKRAKMILIRPNAKHDCQFPLHKTERKALFMLRPGCCMKSCSLEWKDSIGQICSWTAHAAHLYELTVGLWTCTGLGHLWHPVPEKKVLWHILIALLLNSTDWTVPQNLFSPHLSLRVVKALMSTSVPQPNRQQPTSSSSATPPPTHPQQLLGVITQSTLTQALLPSSSVCQSSFSSWRREIHMTRFHVVFQISLFGRFFWTCSALSAVTVVDIYDAITEHSPHDCWQWRHHFSEIHMPFILCNNKNNP